MLLDVQVICKNFSAFLSTLARSNLKWRYTFVEGNNILPLFHREFPQRKLVVSNVGWLILWSIHQRRSKGVLRCSKVSCGRVSFLIKLQACACNFVKTETLAQVFSCEFCEISKNTFFTEQLQTTTSAFCGIILKSATYDCDSKSELWLKKDRTTKFSLFSFFSFFFFYF